MKKKFVVRLIVMLLAIGLLLGAIVGFNLFKDMKIKEFMASRGIPPQTVSTLVAKYEEWQPSLAAVGTLRAVRGVDLALEVAGVVSEVTFRSGEEVKTGDTLLKMRVDDLAAQMQSLETTAQLAEANLKRSAEQLAVKAISQAQHEADQASAKNARAAIATQAALIAKKTLRAPFAGKLGIAKVSPGQYLNPGEAVVTLQQLDPIYMDFAVPQRELGQLQVGRPIKVTVDAFGGRIFSGAITTINPRIDPTTRNVQVEATLRNPGGTLKPGMFGRVSVDVGEKKRYLTLPQTAVTYNPYGETVFVVTQGPSGQGTPPPDAGKAPAPSGKPAPEGTPPAAQQKVAQQTFVTTGPTRGDQVAILKGLEEGAEVVTSGQLKLKNGTPILINNSVQPPNQPNPTPQER